MAQPQLACGALGQGSCDLGGVVGVADDDLRLGQEGLALRRELDASTVALQELEPKLALEAANLLAERRLRDEQPLRGPREVELGGDGHEVPQMAQLHTPRISADYRLRGLSDGPRAAS